MHSYDYDLLIRILIAALLGAIIGLERQKSQKPAGIRTQMLICVGSALLAGISVFMPDKYNTVGVNADPARLMAQIVSGIGFLGAGVIIKGSSNQISGVTTAGTIWISAAVGIAVGAGFYAEAVLCTLLVLCLYPLAKLEHISGLKSGEYTIIVPKQKWNSLAELLENLGIECDLSKTSDGATHIKVHTSQPKRRKLAEALHNSDIQFEIIDEHGTPTLFA